MAKGKVGIVTDSVCDLPQNLIGKLDIDVIYFLVETDSGVFTDTKEISSDNILQYIQEGGDKCKSSEPSPEVYRHIFQKKLESYEEVLHISISSGTSNSHSTAKKAISELGINEKRVYSFDSAHLSTGMGYLVIRAAEMAQEGADMREILVELRNMRERISTTFITEKVDFLYRSGKVSEKVKTLCDRFSVHPVLVMKDGKLTLKSVEWGNYERACKRYLHKELKKTSQIDKTRIFITHSGCPVKMVNWIKDEVVRHCDAKEILVTRASAAVSSNCGPNAFGVLLMKKQ